MGSGRLRKTGPAANQEVIHRASVIIAMPCKPWHGHPMGVLNNRADHEPLPPSVVLEFALVAGASGWTERVLASFCISHCISSDERQRRWPRGVRSIALEFNKIADRAMIEDMSLDQSARLSEILMRRFAHNEDFKQSVRRLAWSDLFHPIDTFQRTLQTTKQMLRSRAGSAGSNALKASWLVLLYSCCVILWLFEQPPYPALQRAVRLSARLAGDQ